MNFKVHPLQPSCHSSVGRSSAWSHTMSGSTIGPDFEPHPCLLTNALKRIFPFTIFMYNIHCFEISLQPIKDFSDDFESIIAV